MSASIVPDTYAAWRHCIEVECRIPLTLAFVQQRLAALEDAGDFHTRQFVERWGEAHRQRVVEWFRQSREALGAAGGVLS